MNRLSSFAAILALCVGCAVDPPATSDGPVLATTFTDQTPEFVVPGALDAVVPIYHPPTETLGSGTVIAPDRVLTAAHVVHDLGVDEDGRLALHIDGSAASVTVEAVGDPDAPHGDWAVLRIDEPRWLQPARVHEAVRRAGWRPRPETEVLLVGYAAGFFPDMHIDIDAPTPCVRAVLRETGDEQPCWYAVGDALDLGGMSGGGVMVWNHELQRAELIGVFRGYVPTETITTETTRVLGLPVTLRETRSRGIAFMIHKLPMLVADPGADRR
ncbi:MAG: trypsin-like peptidase domain-containing protein [Planctomycetes bacterium]|nr:trypsin-like peptidase domain-containing protein [Planctomycetota bacterium]